MTTPYEKHTLTNTSTEIEKIDMGWVESCDGRSKSLAVASYEIMNVKSSETLISSLLPLELSMPEHISVRIQEEASVPSGSHIRGMMHLAQNPNTRKYKRKISHVLVARPATRLTTVEA